jgi:hypothetical protein
MNEDLIKKMRELTKIGREQGRELALEETFEMHPPEWTLADGKPVHLDDLPERRM